MRVCQIFFVLCEIVDEKNKVNICVKNQLQHVSLNYNLAKKFLENLLRMEFDFDFFGLQ